jgi:agmatine deiminase
MSAGVFPTAKAAGFHMPAEWEPHERCWMAWPCRRDFWGDSLPATRRAYADVANAISAFEPVTMLATPGDAGEARRLCAGEVTVLPVELDDSWMRDSGPSFVVDDAGRLAASVFHFNAWGQKHQPWGKDAAIGHRIAEYLRIPTFTATVYMEGGGIHVDGRGSVLTTEQCVLNANRNPGLTKAEASTILGDALGADNVIWLPGDPDDIETDGHVDGIACFVAPGLVLVEISPANGTARYDNLQANLEAVRNAVDAAGEPFEVVTIEEACEADRTSEIFASSYVNYYVANGGVVMPAFGIDRDADARSLIAELYPDREVVQVDIRSIAPGGGGIHCITQQQPAGPG